MDVPTETASVSLDLADAATENGIFAYQAVRRQLQAVLDIIRRRMPRRIATPGGECSINMPPSVTSRPMPGRRARVPHGSSWTATELPEDGMDRTARHDTIVCACPACRGAQRGAGGQTHSHLRPEPEAGHLAHRQCRTTDVGVTLPRQMDHYCNEKLKKHRDGTPDRLRDGSLHPVWRHLGAPHGR